MASGPREHGLSFPCQAQDERSALGARRGLPLTKAMSPDPAPAEAWKETSSAQGPSSRRFWWGDRKASSLEESEATVLMDSSVQGMTFFSVLGYKNTAFIFLNQI